MDAKPHRTSRPTLAATQPHFAQADTGARDRHVLGDFVFPFAARARHRLSVCLHDGRAGYSQRSLCCAADLELEQALTSLLQLALSAFAFSPLASWSRRFLGHASGPTG